MTIRPVSRLPLLAGVVLAAGLAVAGCASTPTGPGPRELEQPGAREDGGFRIPFIGGDEAADAATERVDGIGVNSLLWRASLDTIGFMPLDTTDPFGGVITTEWYNDPQVFNERFRVSVFIVDTRLRADAVTVSVNRQTLSANGWLNAEVNPDTELAIENAILSRARELRLATLPN
jgi:hypothetical protein